MKELLLLFLLPPVNLILAILVGLALLRAWPRLGRWMIGLSAVVLLALAMPAIAGTMLSALETDLPLTPPADDPPQAIVILSAEMQRTSGTPSGVVVGRLTLERILAGAVLYRRTQLPVLVSGGHVQPGEPSVAAVMADSLTRDFQVPVRWIEPDSLTTWQNAEDSAAMLRAAGIRSIYVVTHAWHERRAVIAFRRAGIAVTAAPVLLDPPPAPLLRDFLPRASELQVSYYAIHEWIGCAWYALR